MVPLCCSIELAQHLQLMNTCEHCDGSGEVGPFGWEYPEWHTCRACKGTGVEADPDEEHDRKRDEGLL